MPYALRLFTCPECQAEVWYRGPKDAVVYCVPHRIERSAENARQLHAHEGPFYDAWVLANARGARRIAAGHAAARARRTVENLQNSGPRGSTPLELAG